MFLFMVTYVVMQVKFMAQGDAKKAYMMMLFEGCSILWIPGSFQYLILH